MREPLWYSWAVFLPQPCPYSFLSCFCSLGFREYNIFPLLLLLLLLNRLAAALVVFFCSAVLHELAVGIPLRMLKGWAFWAMFGQVGRRGGQGG